MGFARRTAGLGGLARLGIGVGLALAPDAVGRGWVGDVVDRPGAVAMTRAMGMRDAAIGLGTWLTARSGAPLKGWLRLAAACDLTDLVATSMVPDDELGDMAKVTMAIAGGAAASQLLLAQLVD